MALSRAYRTSGDFAALAEGVQSVATSLISGSNPAFQALRSRTHVRLRQLPGRRASVTDDLSHPETPLSVAELPVERPTLLFYAEE